MSASQLRRRADLSAGSVPAKARPNLDSTLPYEGTLLDKDSSRPNLEGLSYTWRTEWIDEPVTLNSIAFEVRRNILRNLLDAPLFIRVTSGPARRVNPSGSTPSASIRRMWRSGTSKSRSWSRFTSGPPPSLFAWAAAGTHRQPG